MLFDDTYLTIEQPSESVLRDRGSKFLAYAYPISSDQDIKTIVADLKQRHPKADHHCWAMRWSTDRSVFRINDDGEPSGTAGRPILNVLLSRNLTNLAVVVVRYFGGTLLGVPGLINAYKTAAELAIDEARVVEKTVNDVYTLGFEYLQMNEVMRIIKDEDLEILEQHFDNSCMMKITIRKMRVNQVLAKFEKLPSVIAKYEYSD
ncbi:MAG: YigZ family protein [Bacteroidetes bacterium]|nr:YigZ family protein [Bacteroidota bacterium]